MKKYLFIILIGALSGNVFAQYDKDVLQNKINIDEKEITMDQKDITGIQADIAARNAEIQNIVNDNQINTTINLTS